MYLVKYKSIEKCKTWPIAHSMKFPFELVVYHPCVRLVVCNNVINVILMT